MINWNIVVICVTICICKLINKLFDLKKDKEDK